MKRYIETKQGAALAATLVFLVMGSGVSLLQAFAQIA